MRCSTTRGLALLVISDCLANAPGTVLADAQPGAPGRERNLALSAPYVMSSAPNYSHCTDPGDATQLTDGQLTQGQFWTQKGTVGWQGAKYATIALDLGKVQPIAGVSLRTAAGAAGVSWPTTIRIQVSDDGKVYEDIGDLLQLDESEWPLPTKYAVRCLATLKLKTHARYVRLLLIPTGQYLFADEIEVSRGEDSWLGLKTAGRPVADLETCYRECRVEAGVRRRFDNDVASLKQAVLAAKLDDALRNSLTDRLAAVRKRLDETTPPMPPFSFRAILPFNEAHADLFCVQAALWRAAGHPALCAWAAVQWDPLDLFAAPVAPSTAGVAVHLMRGEYRSAAFNMANTTDAPLRASIRFDGFPGSPTPPFVTVHQVLWTDTTSGLAVAAALPEAATQDGSWSVDVAPGLVRQIWLTCRVTDLPPGKHSGRIVVTSKGIDDVAIPVTLHVYPLTFPTKTTLCVGGWSYTDGEGKYGITPANHRQFVEHLRSRFVNAPWATSEVMTKFAFKDGTPSTVELDTKRFDDWLTQWPEARTYFVFLSVGKSFAGAEMGTDAFKQKVGVWISAWVRHLAGKGIEASRLGLLLVDEPRAHEQDEVMIAWAKAIHAAEPKVLLWEDPYYAKPQEGKPELFELADILCPNRPMWLRSGKAFEQFYLDQQKKGRTLHFYSCSGPARLLDPYSYFRLQAWHCWRIGATGSFFWAFGDTSGASSWNEYATVAGPYTPLFIDEQSVTPGKQMEAIRESIEDYESLVMLRKAVDQAVAAGRNDESLAKAQSLLKQAPNEVLDAAGADKLTWHAGKDRTKADTARAAVLEALSSLAPDR